ncbi:MAG: DUF1836 domain-containing protein [Clostridia bacterium]|nr:DUF1836 domain-containing protein [Clostridia bacterium]
MKLMISSEIIPGTILKRADLGGLTGKAFLDQIFMVNEGVMLSGIRKIAGIDGSTLQNWTKRGWVANAHLKRYDIDQVAHILLINMLRSCMQLDRIAWLLQYINGDLFDSSDDIVRESELYDMICRALDLLEEQAVCTPDSLRPVIEVSLADYKETVPGAHVRLANALEIIIASHYASVIKRNSDEKMRELMGAKVISEN